MDSYRYLGPSFLVYTIHVGQEMWPMSIVILMKSWDIQASIPRYNKSYFIVLGHKKICMNHLVLKITIKKYNG